MFGAMLACVASAIVGMVVGLAVYAGLVAITVGISDAPGTGLAALAGMAVGAVAGFLDGVAICLLAYRRPSEARSMQSRAAALGLAIVSVVVLFAPAMLYALS